MQAEALCDAIEANDLRMFHQALKRCVHFNSPLGDWTLLQRACYYGRTRMVTLLIERGARVNAAAAEDLEYGESLAIASRSPVYLACQEGHIDIVRVLAALRADLNEPCNTGTTPVYIASQNGHTDIVRMLAKLKVNVHQTCNGTSPLYVASQEGHTDTVRALAELKGDVNKPRKHGTTPVYIASQCGHLDTVRLLAAELKADVNICEIDGWTPLHAGLVHIYFQFC